MTTNTPTPEATSGATQLTLVVDNLAPWRIDDSTREIGRKGLAQARAVLAAAQPTHELAA